MWRSNLNRSAVESPFLERELDVHHASPDEEAPPGSQIVTGGAWLERTSSVIPKYKPSTFKGGVTDYSVFVPDAAWSATSVDLLLFFHGDRGPCTKYFEPAPKIISKKFGLDKQIVLTGSNVVLAVPALPWLIEREEAVSLAWSAENINRFAGEILDALRPVPQKPLQLGRLIIAGHSHAYAILTPLARDFVKGAAATTSGALGKLDQVWALDTTYGLRHLYALERWARNMPSVRFSAVLENKGPPAKSWDNYVNVLANGFTLPSNLNRCVVKDGHCVIPGAYIARLLTAPKNTGLQC